MNHHYNFLEGITSLFRDEGFSVRSYGNKLSRCKVFTALLMLFSITGIFAQANEYSFAQSNDAYTPISGGTVITSSTDGSPSLDSYASGQLTLPTAFTFANNSYTTFYVTSNGQLQLGGSSAPSSTNYRVLSGGGNNAYLSPFGADLNQIATGVSDIRWQQVGDEIVIQWSNFRRYNKSEKFNFQIRLNTVTSVIKFVYDGTPPFDSSTQYQPQVGIKSSTSSYIGLTVASAGSWNAPVQVRTGIADSSTAAFTASTGFTSGLTYTFTPPTCYAPSALTATLPTQSGITLGWTASTSSPALGYEYYISDANTAPTSSTLPTGVQPTGTSATAGLLNPNTVYYAWVRSACSALDKSAWTGPVSFQTGQVPATLPYTDDFEGAVNFSLINGSESNKWFISTFVNNGGAKSLYVSKNATGANNDYAHTTSTVHAYRDIAIPAGSTVAELTFDFKAGGESTYDYVRVWVTPVSYLPVAGTQTTVALGGAGSVMVADYQNLTSAFTTKSFYVPVSAFAGQTVRLIFEWKNDSGGGVQPAAAIDNVIFKEPSCIPPTAMVAAAGPTGVAFSWTGPATAPAGGYDIYYSTTNTAPAASADASVHVATGNTTTVTSLTSDTVYYYWMRSVCDSGNKSGWVSGGTFMPDCPAVTPTVTQDFATYTGAAPVPACWREATGALGASTSAASLTRNSLWTNENYANFAGANGTAARVELWSTKNEWLISPAIDLGSTVDYQLEYSTVVTQWSSSDPIAMGEKYVKVLISTDGGLTWSTANTLKTYDNSNAPISSVNEVISLASYTGVVKIAFYAYSNTNTQDLRFYIDNFRVRAIPQCFAPTGLAANSINKNGATISWTASTPAPVNGYQYYVSDSNTAPTGATTPTGNVGAGIVTKAIAGLNPSTTYYAWVRANCDTDGQSEWTGPVSFTTLCNYNDITATTPATRCGTGTVSLGATASAGSVAWYNAAGSKVGSGTTFTTPVIDATTTFYVRATDAAAGTGVIGTATTLTGDTEQPTAFCNRWSSYKNQIIYTAQELLSAGLTAGDITSIAFNVATLGDGATNSNFKVRIANTSMSSFSSTAYETAGFTTVYGPATYTHTATGWQTITFNTPYSWDGESNIIIEISHNGANSTNNAKTYYTATTNPMLLYNTSDLTATTGTATLNRLNITFGGQVGCSSPKTAVVATVTTAPAFTLSTNAVAICPGQPSAAVTIATGAADYDTYAWSPSAGVSGDAATGWTFTPSATTTYTLTASQAAGSQCATTTTVTVTVNPAPTAITVSNSANGATCLNTIQTLTATGGSLPSSATIGTGTTTTGIQEELTAFGNRRQNYKSQVIYTAAELLAAGLQPGPITSITYNITSVGDAANNTNFRVKIGTTANASFANSTYLNESSFATVFGPATYTHAVGLNTITFTNPFMWDGTSNIVVAVSYNGVDQYNNAETYYTTTSSNMTLYNYNDLSATTGTTSAKRFNVIFTGLTNFPKTWSPATNLYTDAAATVPYVAGTNANTVYVKSATAGTTTYTVTATTPLTCTSSQTVNAVFEDCAIGWANVQWPASGTINTCDDFTVYARVYKAGVTEAAGQGANITAWVGVSTSNTDPSTWAETSWHLATFNLQADNNDEYMYTVSGLPAGTYYYASRFKYNAGDYYYGGFQGGAWDGTTNVSGVLTVNAIAAPTADAAQSFCNSATVANLQATGTAIKWYAAATNGSALDNTTALVDGTSYYASQTVDGCESTTRTQVTVTINAPAAPTAEAAQSVCNSGTIADLDATGADGAVIKWYAASTGGDALESTTALVNGTSYYASQTIGTCESVTRTMVTVTVNTPAAPTADAAQTVCDSGTIADLNATGADNAIIKWYAASTGGDALESTTALVNGTSYYASQTIGTCESATRTMVTITISTVAVPTVDVVQPTCAVATGSITVNAPVGDGYTYSAGDAFQASPIFTDLAPGTYTITAKNANNCIATTTVIINEAPVAPAVPTVSVTQPSCAMPTGTITVNSPTGVDYTYSIDGNAFQASTAFANITPGEYTVTVKNDQECTASATVTINAAPEVPNAPVAGPLSFCNVAATVADLTATGDNLKWYADETGGTALEATEVVATGTYYVSQTTGECESARTQVDVTVNIVSSPTGEATQQINVSVAEDAIVEDINVTADGTVKWYATEEDAQNGENALAAGTQLVSGATYYITQTVGTCESAALAVTVDVVLGKDDFNMADFRYYPNPVKDVLNVSYTSEITSVTVFNLLGQQVLAKQPNATEAKVDLSTLADATYIVNVTAGNVVKTFKVVKKQ